MERKQESTKLEAAALTTSRDTGSKKPPREHQPCAERGYGGLDITSQPLRMAEVPDGDCELMETPEVWDMLGAKALEVRPHAKQNHLHSRSCSFNICPWASNWEADALA